MREGIAPVIRRADYTAPAYWIRNVELTFDLPSEGASELRFLLTVQPVDDGQPVTVGLGVEL